LWKIGAKAKNLIARGLAGTATDLLRNDADAIIHQLENFVTQQLRLPVEQRQRKAWRKCHVILAAALRTAIAALPSASSWGVVPIVISDEVMQWASTPRRWLGGEPWGPYERWCF